MSKLLKMEAGSRESHEPRLIGEVIKDLLMNSNEPLAVAYCKRHRPDSHLDVDSLSFQTEHGTGDGQEENGNRYIEVRGASR